MSRLVRGLERDGLAAREANADDARSVVVSATPEGRRLLEEGRERRIAELAARFDSLAPEELEVLGRAATLVEQALRFSPSAASTYAGATAERRWSGLSDDSTGSGGTSG